jgi:uncharacterized damage-inducible protein DinB
MTMTTDLQYPVGKFQRADEPLTAAERLTLIDGLAALPAKLRAAVAGLNEEQLTTPYRPGGWSPRQVVHHVADSHINAYVRLKLALTEDEPMIKPYDEAAWAELPDSQLLPLDVSLALLDALHARWTTLLGALPAEAFGRTFRHPELGVMHLDTQLRLYEWHGRHHVAHITHLREQMGW